jgi:hypothetical protein
MRVWIEELGVHRETRFTWRSGLGASFSGQVYREGERNWSRGKKIVEGHIRHVCI